MKIDLSVQEVEHVNSALINQIDVIRRQRNKYPTGSKMYEVFNDEMKAISDLSSKLFHPVKEA